MYHVRLSHPEYLSSDLLVNFLSKNHMQLEHILVEEGSGHDPECQAYNPTALHNHFMSNTTYKNLQIYRRQIKKAFPNLNGNKHYSVKCGDVKGYYYVCKGTGPDWDTGKPKVLSTTFSEEEIQEFHRTFWEVHHERHSQSVFKVDMESMVPGEKPKKRTKMFMERIRDELFEQYPDHMWDLYQSETDRRFLSRYLRQKMGATAKNIDDTIFMRMISGLYNGLPRTATADGYEDEHYDSLILRRYG